MDEVKETLVTGKGTATSAKNFSSAQQDDEFDEAIYNGVNLAMENIIQGLEPLKVKARTLEEKARRMVICNTPKQFAVEKK